ncbi:MAG: hypothetical protein ABI720_10315, partial [Actinomycetes bacterium]
AYAGVATVSPVSASSGQVNDKESNITAPSVNVGAEGSAVIGVFGISRLVTMEPPDAMVEREERSCIPTAPYFLSIEIADQAWAPTGPTGSQVATASGPSPNIGQLVVLNPTS